MDAVKSFNSELSSLYEVRPPISKAKMTAITRGAIKAIKFYKHVVQSVEKFILKCKSEYKVPGLYVIDSIVRQSRHQFGTDKDVFAPRFAKNMQQTFVNLYKCPPEDKSKVIRVLNLWQKNQVFAPEVIQPLFDLADPNHPIYKEINQNNGTIGNISGTTSLPKGSPALQKTPTKVTQQGTDQANAVPHSVNATATPTLDPATLAQLQQLHKLLYQGGAGKSDGQPVHFDRKLLDFDYGDDEDEDPNNPSPKNTNTNNTSIDSVGNLLSNPEVLKQLQTLQNSMLQHGQHQEIDLEKLRKLHEMKQQEDEFDKHLAQTVPHLPFASECEFKPSNNSPAVPSNYFLPMTTDMSQPPPGYKTTQQPPGVGYITQNQDQDGTVSSEVEFVGAGTDNDVEVITVDHGDSRSVSPDRYGSSRRRGRSRSRSRDRGRDRRSRRSSRSRSHSRSRRRRSRSRDREKDREREKEREKDKERKKRGLPPIKKDHLSVCSTTLWVGHLSKLVHQEDLSDTFGEFGGIISIDLIIPRGCAFIVMDRRQDAAKCLTKLKNYKLHGKALTLAWAPGKGVKGKDLKDYWEGDLGVSYIPYGKLKPDMDTELLEDGGVIDEETMPQWMKSKLNQKPLENQSVSDLSNLAATLTSVSSATLDTSQPPPVPGNLLSAPPIALSLVPPFQLNRNLLNAVGMNLQTSLMTNVPIGVPPPNLANALLPNQLLGINSPFGQAPPSLLQTPNVPQMSVAAPTVAVAGNAGDNSQDSVNDNGLLPLPIQTQPNTGFGIVHHADDNMDVEMEDADKMDRPALSDQLLATMGSYNSSGEVNLSAVVNRFNRHDEMDDGRRDRRDNRGGGRNRSRDRDRADRNRDRSRRGGSYDRNRDNRNNPDNRRGENRRDNRGGGGINRWSDRDDSRSVELDRREREKRLNDRLREMANDGSFTARETQDPERHLYPPPASYGGENLGPLENNLPPMDTHDDYDRPGPRMCRPPMGPEFDYPPDFDGPPLPHMELLDDRFLRRDRYVEEIDEYERFSRGPEFYPPHRGDVFGPRGGHPPMRGMRPDGFNGRGHLMGPPRGGMFHPRGPPHLGHIRGPRIGPWMDGVGIRPNFCPPPRFEGPPGFRGHFEDHGHHPPPRHRGQFDRRGGGRFNKYDQQEPTHEGENKSVDFERSERKSRWSMANSPSRQEENNSNRRNSFNKNENDDDIVEQNQENDVADNNNDLVNNVEEDVSDNQGVVEEEAAGNTTPLRDEHLEEFEEKKVVEEDDAGEDQIIENNDEEVEAEDG
ncbi:SR-related and CTD-associated factor 4 [Onthophagus taurus]|uniref:SR-related and CTD-associated factor 4 n=1 Tax=Onthophagus taurus TaxID=166361 RepID=UPI0039BE6471